jgi:hypothetical protein
MGSVHLTAILLAACVAATLCDTTPNELPDISATGPCQAEIVAYCSGAAAQVKRDGCACPAVVIT